MSSDSDIISDGPKTVIANNRGGCHGYRYEKDSCDSGSSHVTCLRLSDSITRQ